MFVVHDTDHHVSAITKGGEQPKGTWIYETSDKIVVGSNARSLLWAFFMLLFAIGFIGIPSVCLTYLIIEPSEHWKGDLLFIILIGLPFLLIGLFAFLPMFLNFTFGKEEIFIGKNGKESYVLSGFGRKARKELFDWNAVTKIYLTTVKIPGKSSAVEKFIVIKLKEKTAKNFNNKPTNEIVLGHNLSEKQKNFVVSALQIFYENIC